MSTKKEQTVEYYAHSAIFYVAQVDELPKADISDLVRAYDAQHAMDQSWEDQ